MSDVAQTQSDSSSVERAVHTNAPVEIAVFDFDGTSIEGSSPVLLVNYLFKCGKLKKRVVSRIALWGLLYKMRLPQNESWVRGLVFSAFEGTPKQEADAFLADFYNKKIACRFRKAADVEIEKHLNAGREVWVVSATFEPIAQQALRQHHFTREISTAMQTDSRGCYTRKVLGLPVEGDEKLHRMVALANELYGEGGWVLTHAYGDHHSDRTLLQRARHPFAVCPDRPLRRIAKRKDWPILEW